MGARVGGAFGAQVQISGDYIARMEDMEAQHELDLKALEAEQRAELQRTLEEKEKAHAEALIDMTLELTEIHQAENERTVAGLKQAHAAEVEALEKEVATGKAMVSQLHNLSLTPEKISGGGGGGWFSPAQ